jgi:cytochrome c553
LAGLVRLGVLVVEAAMKTSLTLIFGAVYALATMTVHAQTSTSSGDATRGEKQAAMCIGCHGIAGYKASFPEVYRAPKIAGQNVGALFNALDAYKTGQRKHPSMRAVAQSLTTQDMQDLAAYYERLGK